jgi:hypothetical protein
MRYTLVFERPGDSVSVKCFVMQCFLRDYCACVGSVGVSLVCKSWSPLLTAGLLLRLTLPPRGWLQASPIRLLPTQHRA